MVAGSASSSPGLQMTQDVAHRQLLSPLAVQVLASLALSQAEVDALVTARAEANPLLVVGPPRRCRWCACTLALGRCPRCSGWPMLTTEPAAEVDEREELRRQARLLVRSALASVVDLVVAHLDERGLLRSPAASVVEERCTVDQWADAVRAVRAAGPPGIAAPDVRACLLAQARWHAAHGGPALLVPIVEDHLDRVATGDLEAIATALAASGPAVDAAVCFLRAKLRPSAMAAPAHTPRSTAPPDVIVRRRGEELEVVVLGASDLGLAVDPELDALRLAGAGGAWLAERVSDAQALLDVVDRRAGVLRRVAGVAVHTQRDFVRQGPAEHRPLTRAAVATALGVHPSTVSRAVQGAVVAMPGGVVLPLAAFFGSAVAVVDRLARMLASTDPPRSDADAAVRLGHAGHVVARRTVTKYRHLLEATAKLSSD